ncbi:MAG: hypothetical protein Q7V58_07445 [Actinomycetota bacterium]|nr:hypothetical protein [Actinomycetota bacterium]
MHYLLAIGAIALPAYLVTQVIRGKLRPQCCAGAPAIPIDRE